MCEYREGPSFVEEVLNVRIRLIETIGHDKVTLCRPELKLALLRFNGDKFRYRCARLGNDNLFAQRNSFKQTREVGFGLVDVDFHGAYTRLSRGLSQVIPANNRTPLLRGS